MGESPKNPTRKTSGRGRIIFPYYNMKEQILMEEILIKQILYGRTDSSGTDFNRNEIRAKFM